MLRAMATLRFWLAGGLLAFASGAVHPQQATVPARESAVKAAFLYKFGSFVDWPAGTFKRADEPLVIGVMNDEAVAEDLTQLAAGRSVEGRPVQLRMSRDGEIPAGVHVLFVGNVRAARMREILAAVPGPVLIVSEQPGALAAGSVINFVNDAGRVRFSVSLTSAEARGLRLSARLLGVALDVEGKAR